MMIPKTKITLFLAVLTLSAFSQALYATTFEEYVDQYGLEYSPEAGAEYAYPSRAQPNDAQDQTDLAYWVHEVLPYERDRNAGMYMVIPKAGVVFPILRPSAEDVTKIEDGEEFNHYPYLEHGGLRYFGQKNKVIAIHSSYKRSDTGRYKTTGQGFLILRSGDKVFFYYRNKQGSYDFAEYTVTVSESTPASNVGIQSQDVSQFMITAFTCYPIGSSKDRRYIKATLTKEIENHSDLTTIPETKLDPTPPVPETEPQEEQLPPDSTDKPITPPQEEPLPEPEPIAEQQQPVQLPQPENISQPQEQDTLPEPSVSDSIGDAGTTPEHAAAPASDSLADSQPANDLLTDSSDIPEVTYADHQGILTVPESSVDLRKVTIASLLRLRNHYINRQLSRISMKIDHITRLPLEYQQFSSFVHFSFGVKKPTHELVGLSQKILWWFKKDTY